MKSNSIWALVTGLAVGFLIGREYTGTKGSADSPSKPGAMAPTSANGPTEIPKEWITEKDLNVTDQFAGLTPQQKYVVLKVMNEKPCDCGCPHGNVAKCKKEDPGCPRAPVILTTAIAHAKLGENFDTVMAAVKKPDSPAAQQPEAAKGPQKVELAAWTPTKGPKYAKVTILEWSDFQ